MGDVIQRNPWTELRRYTAARIALGRAGNSLPTDEILRFGLAHARARDAVHVPLDVDVLDASLRADGWSTLRVRSRATDRACYLRRPDLGRRLDEASVARLSKELRKGFDLAFVAADGLSPAAVQRHVPPLLQAVRLRLPDICSAAPLVIAEQARVALGDEIGALLDANVIVVLIGERPGLSSPDSLGIYLTYGPRLGRTDAERNCISNVRPEGLPYSAAATQLERLIRAAIAQRMTGTGLSDPGDALPKDTGDGK